MSDPFIGQIQTYAFTFPPRGWAFCSGAQITIADNTSLFALIGTFYGGDGRTTLGLPNLVSRTPIGFNMGGALPPSFFTFQIGQVEGAQTHTLTAQQMPSHTHSAAFTPVGASGGPANVEATTDVGDASAPSDGAFLAQPSDLPGPDAPEKIYNASPTPGSLVPLGGVSGGGGSAGGTVIVDPNGAGHSFSILNPFLAVNFSIALIGLFPPRN